MIKYVLIPVGARRRRRRRQRHRQRGFTQLKSSRFISVRLLWDAYISCLVLILCTFTFASFLRYLVGEWEEKEEQRQIRHLWGFPLKRNQPVFREYSVEFGTR